MSKTLSNGTLSLRFMQNAQRARQQAQVELEQAKIKDEAEWEVSRETKEAWGIISSSSDINGAETKTSHEASYIPFMFSTGSSSAEAGSARPRGRRTFNAKGSEVKEEPSEIKAGDPVQAAQTENSKAKRLTSISGFKPPLPIKRKDSGKVKAKTAQESIREDIRTRPPSYHLKDDQPTSTPGGFVKPAGVDGPSVNGSKTAGSSMSLKRERDSIAGDTSSATKRKKKKEVQLIE